MSKITEEQKVAACNKAQVHGFIVQRMHDGDQAFQKAAAAGKKAKRMTPEQALEDVKKANKLIAKQQAKVASVKEIVRKHLKSA